MEDQHGNATEVYYNPSHPASFGGLDLLRQATGKSAQKIKKWSLDQETYTLHKPVNKKFKRKSIITTFIDELWQADLCDLKDLAKYNKGYKYLLNVIDCFSKYAWSMPLKTKTGREVTDAFQQIVEKDGRIPMKLNTDKGKEFKNEVFQKWLADKNIIFFTANNPDIKAAIVERFNRTLKAKMFKYFTWKQTWAYLDILPELMSGYNAKIHSSTGVAPSDATVYNSGLMYMKMFGKQKPRKSRFKFDIGDKVRISKAKLVFEKGYSENWSREIFIVADCLNSEPPLYKLKDQAGEAIDSIFYTQELQLVNEPKEYHIEKVLETKGGKSLVKWMSYPDSFNSWIPTKDIKKL